MRVLHCLNAFDPAADVVRCVNELQRYSKHEHRMIVREQHPLQGLLHYETPDLCTDPTEAFGWADVVIFQFVGWNRGWKIRPWGKPFAFRNINIRYDEDKDKFWAEDQYNANNLSSYNLRASSHVGAGDFLPDCRWLPDLIPIDQEEYMPDFGMRPACTSYIKHRDELAHKIKNGLCCEMLAHNEVLRRRKHTATCVIDNVCDGHFGLAGLEAMSLGLPTVVYNHGKTRAALKELATEYPPFVECGPSVNGAVDASMWANQDIKHNHELRRASRAWMEQYWNSRRIIDMYWDPFVEELHG